MDAGVIDRPVRVVAPRLEGIAFQDVFADAMPWRFTTEAIEAYLPHLAAEGRRCLTVAGSGDQAVDLLAAGAGEVVIFDSMNNALAMTDHKLTSLRDWQGDCGTFLSTYGTDWLDRPTGRRDDGFRDNYIAKCLGRIASYDPTIPIFRQHQIWRWARYFSDEAFFRQARRAVGDAMAQGRVRSVQADVRDLVRIPRIGTFDVVVLSNIVSTIVRSLRWPAQILE